MSKARGPYRVDPLGYKKANEALDKKAENARELGLDYEPAQQEPIKQGWDVDTLLDKPIPLKDFYKPAQQEPFGYFRYDLRLDAWVQNRAGTQGTPFYTSPPAQQNIRNATLDEIATKIEAMPFGDTAASFAVWIREQKT